jgi:hypothetical protein
MGKYRISLRDSEGSRAAPTTAFAPASSETGVQRRSNKPEWTEPSARVRNETDGASFRRQSQAKDPRHATSKKSRKGDGSV